MGLFDRSKKVRKDATTPPPPPPPPKDSPPPAYGGYGQNAAAQQHGANPSQQQQQLQHHPQAPWHGDSVTAAQQAAAAGGISTAGGMGSTDRPPAVRIPAAYAAHRREPALLPRRAHSASRGAASTGVGGRNNLDQKIGEIGGALGKLDIVQAVNIARDAVPVVHVVNIGSVVPYAAHLGLFDGPPPWQAVVPADLLNQTAAMVDQIAGRFNDVMTSIDRESFSGNEGDLYGYPPAASPDPPPAQVADRGVKPTKKGRDAPKGQTTAVAASMVSGNYFAKVELYANSRLPMHLPSLKL